MFYSWYTFFCSVLNELLGSFSLYFSLTFVAKRAIFPLSVVLVKLGRVFEVEGCESNFGFDHSGVCQGIGVISKVYESNGGRGNNALIS